METPLSLQGVIPKLMKKCEKERDRLLTYVNVVYRGDLECLDALAKLLAKDEITESEFKKIYRKNYVADCCYDNVLANINTETIANNLKTIRKDAQKIDKELDELAEEFAKK